MMSRTWIICAAIACLAECADEDDKARGHGETRRTPRFLRDPRMTCATFAEAVNHYVE